MVPLRIRNRAGQLTAPVMSTNRYQFSTSKSWYLEFVVTE